VRLVVEEYPVKRGDSIRFIGIEIDPDEWPEGISGSALQELTGSGEWQMEKP
jgi:hypothetical protein